MIGSGRSRRLTVVIALSLAGCATSSGGGGGDDSTKYFSRGPGTYVSVKLDGTRLYGPELDVTHFPDGYRGQMGGHLVDLRAEGGRITGTIANALTDLHVEPLADGTLLQGILAGNLSRWEFGADRLKGHLGSFDFDYLRRDANTLRYENRTGQSWVDLPVTLLSRPIDEQAVWLALALGMPQR